MLTKRQRIAHWIGLDSERRRRAEIVAKVTARLSESARDPRGLPAAKWGSVDPAAAKAWANAQAAMAAQSSSALGKALCFGFQRPENENFGTITVTTGSPP